VNVRMGKLPSRPLATQIGVKSGRLSTGCQRHVVFTCRVLGDHRRRHKTLRNSPGLRLPLHLKRPRSLLSSLSYTFPFISSTTSLPPRRFHPSSPSPDHAFRAPPFSPILHPRRALPSPRRPIHPGTRARQSQTRLPPRRCRLHHLLNHQLEYTPLVCAEVPRWWGRVVWFGDGPGTGEGRRGGEGE